MELLKNNEWAGLCVGEAGNDISIQGVHGQVCGWMVLAVVAYVRLLGI